MGVFSNLPGLGDVALTSTWEFGGKRGAVVVMHSPQLWQIPNVNVLNRLVDVAEVKGKHIVFEAYMCPAASLYLSNKSESICGSSFSQVLTIFPGR